MKAENDPAQTAIPPQFDANNDHHSVVRRLLPGLCLAATLILQSILTWSALDPAIGFDDANITQVYARHIAEGHGYVYNVGGERVEGSTSLVWTLLNALAFLTPYPIAAITLLCWGLTASILLVSGQIVRELGGSSYARALNYLMFNLYPWFFGWSFWSLMDITLWVLAISGFVWALVRLHVPGKPHDPAKAIALVFAALLPLVRPEGIAVVLGVAAFMLVWRSSCLRAREIAVRVATLGIVSLCVATAWRLSYFGYPVPNTFYAKASSDLPGQFAQGYEYVEDFLIDPAVKILMFGLVASLPLLLLSRHSARRFFGPFVVYLVLSALAVYTALGGDHFGSYRFFHFAIPICLPMISVSMEEVGRWMRTRIGRLAYLLAGTVALLFGFSVLFFASEFHETGGKIRFELRVAEDQKQIGEILSRIPERPSLATLPAGGIKMGYDGIVYDVLGLNWVEMAHAGDAQTGLPKNHGGFDADLFLSTRPDLAFARLGNCSDARDVMKAFSRKVTGNIFQSDAFEEIYLPMCSDEIVLFVRRDLEPIMLAEGYRRHFVSR